MRRRVAAVGIAAAFWSVPMAATAHGIGGRQDLPVPVPYFAAGAAVVLVVSFVALARLWPDARLQDQRQPLVVSSSPWLGRILGTIGMVALVLTITAGLFGVDNSSRNPASVILFVFFWLAVPFVAGFVIDIYEAITPWPRLARLFGLGEVERPDVVDRLGYLPAVGVLLAFTWFELVAPDNGPRMIAIAAVVYTVYLLAMSWWMGRRGAVEVADGFAVYTRLFGAMSSYRIERDGNLVSRGWLRSLTAIPERRGLALLLVTMIGTVTFDGLSATPYYGDSVAEPILSALIDAGVSNRLGSMIVGTVGWAVTLVVIWLLYLGASVAAARLASSPMTGREVASSFAHTLVPIAFAYAFAHYFTLLIFEGQLILSTLSDPFGLGWNLFGTADRRVDFGLIAGGAAWVWYVQLAAIVGGHVLGVVLAHDRAIAVFGSSRAVASQYAMLVLMVILTGIGLFILAAG